jgi:two-component system sensor histidine kinase YesM
MLKMLRNLPNRTRNFMANFKIQNRLFAGSVALITVILLCLYFLSQSLLLNLTIQKQADFETDSIKQVKNYAKSIFTETEGYMETLYRFLSARGMLTDRYDSSDVNDMLKYNSGVASAINTIVLNKAFLENVIILGRNNNGCIYAQRDIRYETTSIDPDFDFRTFLAAVDLFRPEGGSNFPFLYNGGTELREGGNSGKQIHDAISGKIIMVRQLRNDAGSVEGVAVISFNNFISEIIPSGYNNKSLYLTDRTGTVVWSNTLSGSAQAIAPERIPGEGKSGSSLKKINGEAYLIINGGLDPYDLRITSYIPVDSFYKTDLAVRLYVVLFGFCCILLAFLSSYFFSRSTCSQLKNLADQLSSGKEALPERIEVFRSGRPYEKLSLRMKIYIHFGITVFLPTILFVSFISYFNYCGYRDKIIELTSSSVKQLKWNIDNKITNYDNVSFSTIYEANIQEAYTRKTEEENANSAKQKIGEVFLSKKIKNKDILSFSLYENDGKMLYSNIPFDTFPATGIHPEFYAVLKSSQGKMVYLGASRDYLGLGPTLLFARTINDLYYNFGSRLGYLVFSVDQEAVNSLIREVKLGDSAYFFLTDRTGEIILNNNPGQESPLPENILYQSSFKAGKDGFSTLKYANESYLVFNSPLKMKDMQITGVIPRREIISKVYPLVWYSALMMALSLIVLVLVSILITHGITKPLERLEAVMREIRNENFDVRMEYKGRDEVAILTENFNLMIDRLNRLIYENYQSKLHESELMFLEKEAQLNALQQQINPHFLYNTLESIKWMAYKIDAIDICNMATALGRFFRGAIAKGKDYITFRQEIEHLENYIYIQKIRYQGKLDVKMDISEEILEFTTIKLILQPVVENAILHGLEKVKTGGLVQIKGYREQDLVRFEIADNGIGMSPEDLEVLRRRITDSPASESDKSSIGLSNVYKRLMLYFGNKCGFDLESEVGVGTKVRISIPIHTIK